MTEFDGSSGTALRSADDNHQTPEAMGFGAGIDEDGPSSMLEVLRERVEAREADEVEPWTHEVADIGVRIVCNPQVENPDYQRWVKAALPKARGRGRPRTVGAMDLDQLALSARAIIATNLRVEVYNKRTKAWAPVSDKGEALTLDDPGMLRAFGVMDPVSLLRKLFRRDADLINAGQDLLAAAGYLDSEDDDDDPA
jgi:hypothetical protein